MRSAAVVRVLISTTGSVASAGSDLSSRHTVTPSGPGSSTSISTSAGRRSRTDGRTASPELTTTGWYPAARSQLSNTAFWSSSSSAIRIRVGRDATDAAAGSGSAPRARSRSNASRMAASPRRAPTSSVS